MELLIPTSDKGVYGAFFTPSYIVDYIISTVAPTKTERVADLSCGSGAFLLGIVKYFTSKYGISVKQCVKNNLLGADILPYNVRRSKTLIIIYALSLGETINETEINITHCDSLSNKWNDKIDVVVGNPLALSFKIWTIIQDSSFLKTIHQPTFAHSTCTSPSLNLDIDCFQTKVD